jgi:quercetin dioxygenase-like cupin family protein
MGSDAIFKLSELVEYQEGSVVSRKLAGTPGGNITIFAFAEGEELSEHSTPHTAVLSVLHGTAQIRIANDVHEVPAGHTIILPSGVPHAVKAIEAFKMALTMLRVPS